MSGSKGFRFWRGAGLAAAVVVFAGMVFVGCEEEDGDNIVYGRLTDSRDGQTYRTVKIGSQTWMAENLNFNAAGGKCYGDGDSVFHYNEVHGFILPDAEIQANCDTYGRLYDWAAVMGFPSSCNENECEGQVRKKHRGICPSGWHVPSSAEWGTLAEYVTYAERRNMAGRKLKSAAGWTADSGYIPGTDDYGFSTLPGGYGLDGWFRDIGYKGYWWTTKEFSGGVLRWEMSYHMDDSFAMPGRKAALLSLRCVAD